MIQKEPILFELDLSQVKKEKSKKQPLPDIHFPTPHMKELLIDKRG